MRILLAEDERDLNYVITQKLTSDGYSVTVVLTGRKPSIFCLIRITTS